MQIFASHPEPAESAAALDDLRLNKMILETAQILSTARRLLGDDSPILYKATHAKHPCILWAMHSYQNHYWLCSHFYWLNRIREARGFGVHLTWTKLGAEFHAPPRDLFKFEHQTEFANCTPYKDMPVHDAYRRLLTEKWATDKRPPRWTNASAPTWRRDYAEPQETLHV